MHSNLSEKYGNIFGEGEQVTVYFDTIRGELSFAKNGESYGVAYTNPSFQTQQFFPAVYIATGSTVRIYN
jgi:hypothetical protein